MRLGFMPAGQAEGELLASRKKILSRHAHGSAVQHGRRAVAVVAAGVLTCLATIGPWPPAPASAAPTLLLMHPGGFTGGAPSDEDNAAAYAQSLGFRARSLNYPLCDLGSALRYTAQAAKVVNHRVYAYGDSAGGTLAARLTERGLARAGAGYSPVADVKRYVHGHSSSCIGSTDQATTYRASPIAHPAERHFVELIASAEGFVSRPDEVSWALADPLVHPWYVDGFHIGGGTAKPTYLTNMRQAIDWLALRAGLSGA